MGCEKKRDGKGKREGRDVKREERVFRARNLNKYGDRIY